MQKSLHQVLLACLAVCLLPGIAHALWQDESGRIKLIGKLKTQATFRTEDAPDNNPIQIEAGDMTSQRWLAMLELKHDVGEIGRGWKTSSYLQGRAFYDGVWDYGPKEFSDDDYRAEYCFDNRDQINDLKDGIELYMASVDLTKGFFFSRTGRQTLSWGEMSTIRILDGTNPLNTSSLAVDMLERRIPLWMERINLAFESVGPFDSISLDTYYVPGKIDNTYQEEMIDGSPIVPTIGRDTVEDLQDPFSLASLKQVLDMEDSDIDADRYGIKLGLMFQGLDLNFAYYRMYSDMPVPQINIDALPNLTIDTSTLNFHDIFGSILGDNKVEVDLTRDTVDVYGTSFNYNIAPIETVVRGEFAYFNNVPKITPGNITDLIQALGPKVTIPGQSGGIGSFLGQLDLGNIATMQLPFVVGDIPTYDVIKYGLAFDKFTKIPFLNTEDFMFTFEYVGSKILKYKDHTIVFPWQEPWDDDRDGSWDTVYEPEYSNTFILITRTNYLNGNLVPQLVSMLEMESHALVLIPTLTYEWRSLQFQMQYFFTQSRDYSGTMGMLDSRDEVTFNITWSF